VSPLHSLTNILADSELTLANFALIDEMLLSKFNINRSPIEM